MIITSFLFFLLLFVAIGAASVMKSRGTNRDYLVAGGSVQPWLVALSAVATCNSGYMFIGQIGYTYATGLSSMWLGFGWIFGDLLASLAIGRKLRVTSEKRELLSFGGLLSRWHGTHFPKLRFLVGIITIAFLGTYAAAQLKAGSKALHVLLGWDYSTGAIIGFFVVVIYCMAGGIRASIWTDAAQSFVMIFAMGLLLWVTVDHVGGPAAFSEQLAQVSDTYMDVAPADLLWNNALGLGLFIAGWMFAGFAVAGQPHVMVRYMTLDDPKNITRVRVYYYTWYTLFYAGAIGVGLAARILIPETEAFDAELAMPVLSKELLPEVLLGLVLAGLFAATMSTADSQILSCSAALTRDVVPRRFDTMWVTKAGTLLVALLALGVALFGSSNVFDLVLVAWSVLGAAFAPLLFVYAMGRRVSEWHAIAMIAIGIGTTLSWRALGLSGYIYEVAPGILAGLLVYALGALFGQAKTETHLR